MILYSNNNIIVDLYKLCYIAICSVCRAICRTFEYTRTLRPWHHRHLSAVAGDDCVGAAPFCSRRWCWHGALRGWCCDVVLTADVSSSINPMQTIARLSLSLAPGSLQDFVQEFSRKSPRILWELSDSPGILEFLWSSEEYSWNSPRI